jgi:hypothetical protein
MTRGVIPLLSELGIEAISVGVNGGSSPPAGTYPMTTRMYRCLN